MSAKIVVRYFALLRDVAGKSNESLTVATGATASNVFRSLAEKYGFPLGLADVRVAVNDEFTDSEHALRDGDQLVFIPPVSGG